MKIHQLVLATLIFGIFFIQSELIVAQNPISRAKIETIVKLTKFIDWSENRNFANSKKMIYIITDKNADMNSANQFKSDGNLYSWEIKYCNNLDEIEKGSVIFLTKDQKENVKKAIALSKKVDILTISDNMPYFCQDGGMINLIDQGNQIQFEINYRIIQNKSLEINSKVLALAKIYD